MVCFHRLSHVPSLLRWRPVCHPVHVRSPHGVPVFAFRIWTIHWPRQHTRRVGNPKAVTGQTDQKGQSKLREIKIQYVPLTASRSSTDTVIDAEVDNFLLTSVSNGRFLSCFFTGGSPDFYLSGVVPVNSLEQRATFCNYVWHSIPWNDYDMVVFWCWCVLERDVYVRVQL